MMRGRDRLTRDINGERNAEMQSTSQVRAALKELETLLPDTAVRVAGDARTLFQSARS